MYKRALVALDSDEDSAQQVLEAAHDQADVLNVLHVLDPHEVQYSVDPTFVGRMTRALQAQAVSSASARIHKFCNESGFEFGDIEVILGRTAKLIGEKALEKQCDVIVLGSHGRHGWQRILGSTAHAVLQGAPVDVLAHRLRSFG